MFLNFFAKKKKPAAAAPAAPTPAVPKDAILSGTLPPGETYYSTVQAAVKALEDAGFTLLSISTGGETSGHMWTRAYRAAYTDLQKFLLHGREDYKAECEKAAAGGGPAPDWDTTVFRLEGTLDEATVRLRISLPENDVPGHTSPPPAARWTLMFPRELAESTAVLETVQLLKKLNNE